MIVSVLATLVELWGEKVLPISFSRSMCVSSLPRDIVLGPVAYANRVKYTYHTYIFRFGE